MSAPRTSPGTGRSRRVVILATALVVGSSVLAATLPSTAGGTAASWATLSGSGAWFSAGSAVRSVPALSGPASGGLTAPTPTPSAAGIDPGQYVLLTASASGGTPPYSYQWYSGTYPQCSGDVIPLTTGPVFNASAAYGNLYYCYTVNDSAVPSAHATPTTAALVSIGSALVAGAVTPSTVTLDSGRSVALTSHPGGGTPPYTISWFASATGSPSCTLTSAGSGATLTASPTTNTTYCYQVTDASVGLPLVSALSTAATVLVDPALVPGAVTPSAPTVDSGQSVVLSASPSGGTGPGTYAIQWYSGTATTCSASMAKVGSNSTTYTATPTATTNYCYSVSDASYGSISLFSALDSVKVNTRLAASTPTPLTPGIDVGQSITLSASVTGGTTPYSAYQWYSGYFSSCSSDSPIAGQTNSTLVATPGGSSYYCYSVTDSATSKATSYSPTDLVQVNPVLSGGIPSPATPIIDSGSSITLTAGPAGGTPPYSYTWFTGIFSICANDTTSAGSGSAISIHPTANAYYCYKVTDSSPGTPADTALSVTDLITVNTALVAGPLTPASPTLDAGQTVVLTAAPSGGTPIYTIAWFTGSPCTTPITGATGLTRTVSPTITTIYCYTVTDGSANPPTQRSASDQVTVNPAVVAAAITPSSPVLDLGQTVTLTASGSGGKGPYAYQWYSGSSSSCASDTNLLGTATTQLVAPAVTTFFCYKVSDSLAVPGTANSTTDLVTVNPALFAGAITSNATILDAGQQSATLTANPLGGSPAYRFSWRSGPSTNCTLDNVTVKGTTSTLTVKPTTTTYYCYVVQDASTGTPAVNSTSAAYKVTVNPEFVNSGILPGSPVINPGQHQLLTANVSGGTPPYTYAWYVGPSARCQNDTKIPGASGTTYNASPSTTLYYCVLATDSSNGAPAGSLFSPADEIFINVPPGPTLLGLPQQTGLILLGVLGGLCALVGLGIFLRIRRGRGRGPATDFL